MPWELALHAAKQSASFVCDNQIIHVEHQLVMQVVQSKEARKTPREMVHRDGKLLYF